MGVQNRDLPSAPAALEVRWVRRRHVGSACGAVAASRSWCPGVAAAGASLQARVAGIRSLDLARMGLAWLSPLRRGQRSQALLAMMNCWRAALW